MCCDCTLLWVFPSNLRLQQYLLGRGLTEDDLTEGMLQVLGTDGKVLMYNVPLVKTNGVRNECAIAGTGAILMTISVSLGPATRCPHA